MPQTQLPRIGGVGGAPELTATRPILLDGDDLGRRYNEHVSGTDTGATFDGVTDDAANLQSLVASNRVVNLPAGTAMIGTELTMAALSNVTIRGQGMGVTTLKCSAANITGLFQITNSVNVTIEDLTLDLNESGTTDQANVLHQMAIYLIATSTTGIQNFNLRRVEIKDGHQRGVSTSTTTQGTHPMEVTIADCWLHDIDGIGIVIDDCSLLRIRDNRMKSCGSDGFENILVSGASGAQAKNVRITDNYILDGGWHGIALTRVGDFRIADNHFESCGDEKGGSNNYGVVVSLGCDHGTVADNVFKNNVTGGISVDVADAASTVYPAHVAVVGNVVEGGDTNGIWVNAASEVTVVGNVVNGAAQDGIALANSTDCLVAGNVLENNGAYGIDITESWATGGHTIGANHFENNTSGTINDTATTKSTATYSATNVSTDRTFDADTVAVAELADIVGTLIDDIRNGKAIL